jgi:hypothetical protein
VIDTKKKIMPKKKRKYDSKKKRNKTKSATAFVLSFISRSSMIRFLIFR